jgi:quercetin dioxygenase-like cupin family protein
MEPYKVEFDSLPWEVPMSGVRVKVFRDGQKQMRLAEFSSKFVEPHWCEKGHIGFVLRGELEIDFHGTLVRYAEGSGIFIPQGATHGHKARSVTTSVLLFLVEDV